jgi:hypothetical protein
MTPVLNIYLKKEAGGTPIALTDCRKRLNPGGLLVTPSTITMEDQHAAAKTST